MNIGDRVQVTRAYPERARHGLTGTVVHVDGLFVRADLDALPAHRGRFTGLPGRPFLPEELEVISG